MSVEPGHRDTWSAPARGWPRFVAGISEEAFWSRVDIGAPDECWPWARSINMWGYGQAPTGRRMRWQMAHRVAFEAAAGRPPVGLVRHLCHNKACCNPAHLREGDHKDNAQDNLRDGLPLGRPRQTHCLRGHEMAENSTGKRQQCSVRCSPRHPDGERSAGD